MRKNKYQYLFVVQGNYGQGFEDLTCSESYKAAREDLKSYRDNEHYPHRLIQRRELNI